MISQPSGTQRIRNMVFRIYPENGGGAVETPNILATVYGKPRLYSVICTVTSERVYFRCGHLSALAGWLVGDASTLITLTAAPASQQVTMGDRASKALADSIPPGEPRTYTALSERKNIPLSTLHHRIQGRRSKEQKAQSQ